jgi:uncharacterized protein
LLLPKCDFTLGIAHYFYIMANRLINEQSPYLLQHANNPVAWYPWGDEAFEKAKAEHKPVIVSIGYAACHWCHVMEHESFEDEATAAYMNEHFVCIKVDREEHPDVDHMYMDAVQAIGGSGGWPLNVFVTPERAPFYGGTYYPPRAAYNRPSWMQLLERMNHIWHEQQDEVAHQAGQLINHLQQASQKFYKSTAEDIDKDVPGKIAENLLKQADKEKGGFGNAPKFPGTMAISFLIEHYHFTGHAPSLEHAIRSLDAMIEGGIYDQLAGGFARYSTDREWLAPHFEKMLYDNALLISALCDGYSVTRKERYKEVIDETIAFVERELKDKSGGYYCALDADSEGVEGKFYTWKWAEWVDALSSFDSAQDDPFDSAQDDIASAEIEEQYFGVKREGNWEGTNILHVAKSMAQIAEENKLTIEAVTERIDKVKHKLLAVREGRIRPLTDDKSLLSWNALMNIALSKAATVFDNERYAQRASEHMEWMLANFEVNGALKHAWKNGVAKIAAKLDDYAYLVQALLQLSPATGENKWVLKAKVLTDVVISEFSHPEGFFYFTAEGQKDIPVRKVDLYDGATPSANAIICHNLTLLGTCMQQSEWTAQAAAMLRNMSDTAARYSYSFGYWAILLQRKIKGWKTVVITGKEARSYYSQLVSNYIPQGFLLTLQKEISELPILEKKFFADKMYIFVCSEQACLSPVSAVDEGLSLIDQ